MFFITADIHLTEQPLDAYRFDVFHTIMNLAKKSNDDSHILFILGDLTDKKDRHPAELVSKVVGVMRTLVRYNFEVYILTGNHDYINPDNPFFKFLSEVPGVEMITKTMFINLPVDRIEKLILAIPNNVEKDFNEELRNSLKKDIPDIIFAHHTFNGAVGSNGYALEGTKYKAAQKIQVVSGDIHVPQKLTKNIMYVGAPHTVKFGDNYDPRILIYQNKKLVSVRVNPPRKILVEASTLKDIEKQYKKLSITKDDMVKVRFNLSREELFNWDNIKEDAKRYNIGHPQFIVELNVQKDDKPGKKIKHKLSEVDIFNDYCKKNSISEKLKKIGRSILGI